MSVRVVCPECGATTVNENPARTAVHCQQCGKEVQVPGAPVAALPPMPKRSATVTAPADDPGFELIDEEEVKTDARPPVRRAADADDGDWVDGAPRRPVVGARDDDDEDEDDAPHRRASRRRDEDDDDDDRPPRSRARRDDDDDDDGASKKSGDEDFEVVRDAEDEDEDPLQRRCAARLARLAEEGESARGRDRDGDDDDRPRRRPPSKSKAPLLVLALLAFLLLGAGGGAAAYFLWPKDDDSTPIVRNNDPEPEDVPPGDPGVIDPKKDDAKPKDTKPKDTKTTDAKTKEKQPVDTKQKDNQPVDTKGKETKPKDNQPVDAKGKETKPKDDKQPTVASKPKLVQPVAGRLPITPAEMATPHVEVELPCQAREACVGGGGRYLIFHCPAKRKLVVFDTSTLKVVKTMTLGADEALIAAGMSKILVVYPTEKQVVRYDLATFAPDLDAPLLTAQKPTDVAMGSATVGPLVVGGIPSQGNASKMSLMFLDVETLNEVPIDRAEGEFKVTFGAAAHLRISRGWAHGRGVVSTAPAERDSDRPAQREHDRRLVPGRLGRIRCTGSRRGDPVHPGRHVQHQGRTGATSRDGGPGRARELVS